MLKTDQMVYGYPQPYGSSLENPFSGEVTKKPQGLLCSGLSSSPPGWSVVKPPRHYLRFGIRAALDCIAMAGIVLFTALITFLLGS